MSCDLGKFNWLRGEQSGSVEIARARERSRSNNKKPCRTEPIATAAARGSNDSPWYMHQQVSESTSVTVLTHHKVLQEILQIR